MYAILKPDGSLHRVVNEALPGGSTDYSSFGVLPVNQTVPEGFSRTGWQIINGVCEPVLVETPTPTVFVPPEIGRGQLHAAFTVLGWITPASPSTIVAETHTWISGMIEAAIADSGERTVAHALWGTATTFKRNHPFMALVAAMAGKTGEDLDTLFITGSSF